MSGFLDSWKPSWLQIVLFCIGGGLLYLGEDWGIPGATEIGIACLGALLIVVGVEIGFQRLVTFRAEGWANVVLAYRGVLELLWGLIFTGLGILIVAALAMDRLVPRQASDFWGQLLLSRTGLGVVLAVVGLMLMLNGLIRALAGSARSPSKRPRGLIALSDKAAGAIVLLLGAAISLAGLVLLVVRV